MFASKKLHPHLYFCALRVPRFPHGDDGGPHLHTGHDAVDGNHLADEPPKQLKLPRRRKHHGEHVVLLGGPLRAQRQEEAEHVESPTAWSTNPAEARCSMTTV